MLLELGEQSELRVSKPKISTIPHKILIKFKMLPTKCSTQTPHSYRKTIFYLPRRTQAKDQPQRSFNLYSSRILKAEHKKYLIRETFSTKQREN